MDTKADAPSDLPHERSGITNSYVSSPGSQKTMRSRAVLRFVELILVFISPSCPALPTLCQRVCHNTSVYDSLILFLLHPAGHPSNICKRFNPSRLTSSTARSHVVGSTVPQWPTSCDGVGLNIRVALITRNFGKYGPRTRGASSELGICQISGKGNIKL